METSGVFFALGNEYLIPLSTNFRNTDVDSFIDGGNRIPRQNHWLAESEWHTHRQVL